jgi:4-amino-4-deoxy-L-arabinose transferase-like glycosyltransferase
MFPVPAVRSILHFLARNWVFNAAFTVGLGLRIVTMLGFPPAIWFAGDSITYVNVAITHVPSLSRESGYSLMLLALKPLHSFAVVAAVQHLMGLAIAVMIYVLLRRRGLPRWGATLAALPVLLDAYQIQLEHELLPDIPFAFLVMAAVTLVGWWRDRQRPAWASATAAALLGLAATCWPVGLPLLIVLLAVLLVRRAGWRAIAAAAAAGALPLALYLAWFDRAHDQVAFNTSSGVFLWSRTMTFANCQIIKPPADEQALCPDKPVGQRETASLWIWERSSPLARMDGRFTVTTNALTGDFARRAVLAQPLGYARAVLDGFALTFTWNRPPRPTPLMSRRYQFSLATHDWDHHHGLRATEIALVQREYTGGHLAYTKAVKPFSTFMIGYQRFGYLRGTMVGIGLLLGLGAIVRAWLGGRYRTGHGRGESRELGGPALVPWLTGLTVLLVPVMTADFSLRYVVPALPAICLAAGCLFLQPDPLPMPAPSQAGPRPADELGGLDGLNEGQAGDPEGRRDGRISTGPLPAQA